MEVESAYCAGGSIVAGVGVTLVNVDLTVCTSVARSTCTRVGVETIL